MQGAGGDKAERREQFLDNTWSSETGFIRRANIRNKIMFGTKKNTVSFCQVHIQIWGSAENFKSWGCEHPYHVNGR